MSASNPRQANFQLRTNMDWEEIRRRLRSEYGSGVQSEAEISGVLADVDKDLEDCDAEFRRLQSRIIALQNQRKRLEEYKISLRFLRSPIRRLPNEIILRIFDSACEMNELTSKKLQTMPALAISSICSRWRALAQSYPDLWSRIRLQLWTTPRHLPGLPILDIYLHFSKQSPLTLEIPSMGSEELQADHLEVCAKLVACSHRWKKFSTEKSTIYDTVMAQNPRNFPVLEQLLIPYIFFYKETTLNHFQHASNLKVLRLCYIKNWEDMQQRKFPWRQITELDVAQCEDVMKPIFEMCNLRELRFRQYYGESTVKLCSPPITAPSVQKLTLTLRQTSYPERERLANVVFASITCPALTSLFIEGIDRYKSPWPRDAVKGFISRSSFHLTTLSIKSVPLSDSDLIDLLCCLPSLHHLTIDDSNTTSPGSITPLLIQSLHAFHRTSSVALFSVLVKRLQTLSLTTSVEAQEAFNDRNFVDMVSSRWFLDGYGSDSDSINSNGGMACLRSVVMRFTKRAIDEEVYKPLKYLEEEGMRVVVIGRNS